MIFQATSRAAHHAAQLHRQQVMHTIIQNNLRRQRTFTVVPTPTQPTTTSMGYDVVRTFTILESEAVDGVMQFELLVDGTSRWIGTGDDRADGLLRIMMEIEEDES